MLTFIRPLIIIFPSTKSFDKQYNKITKILCIIIKGYNEKSKRKFQN